MFSIILPYTRQKAIRVRRAGVGLGRVEGVGRWVGSVGIGRWGSDGWFGGPRPAIHLEQTHTHTQTHRPVLNLDPIHPTRSVTPSLRFNLLGYNEALRYLIECFVV